MTDDIETRVGEVPGVDAVSVETVADKVWTRERMTESARGEREEYFRERVVEHGLSPAYDGERWVDGEGWTDGERGANGERGADGEREIDGEREVNGEREIDGLGGDSTDWR